MTKNKGKHQLYTHRTAIREMETTWGEQDTAELNPRRRDKRNKTNKKAQGTLNQEIKQDVTTWGKHMNQLNTPREELNAKATREKMNETKEEHMNNHQRP